MERRISCDGVPRRSARETGGAERFRAERSRRFSGFRCINSSRMTSIHSSSLLGERGTSHSLRRRVRGACTCGGFALSSIVDHVSVLLAVNEKKSTADRQPTQMVFSIRDLKRLHERGRVRVAVLQ